MVSFTRTPTQIDGNRAELLICILPKKNLATDLMFQVIVDQFTQRNVFLLEFASFIVENHLCVSKALIKH